MVLSAAHVVLEAVKLASEADVEALQDIVAQHPLILQLELVLRILLTYLPESTDPSLYTGFLSDFTAGKLHNSSRDHRRSAAIGELSTIEAQCRVRKLHLLAMSTPPGCESAVVDPLTVFLLDRAHRIDSETGTLPLSQKLLEPFLGHSRYIREWMLSTLLPLLRLDYEYYPGRAPAYSLEVFEALRGSAAVTALLSESLRSNDEYRRTNIGRDLRGLVAPWIYGYTENKRRRLGRKETSNQAPVHLLTQDNEGDSSRSGWSLVNEWLLDLSIRDFPSAVDMIEQWDGPRDVDYGGWDDNALQIDAAESHENMHSYAQAAISTIYLTADASKHTLEGSKTILRRITQILNLPQLSMSGTTTVTSSKPRQIPASLLASIKLPHLSRGNLLEETNPLSNPCDDAIELACLSVISAQILQALGCAQATKDCLTLALFGTQVDQSELLRRIIHSLQEGKSENNEDGGWRQFRYDIMWLRDWGLPRNVSPEVSRSDSLGVLSKIDRLEVEMQILRALLTEGYYKLATDLYCSTESHPIPLDQVEKVALEVAFSCYDKASNGNKSRGGIKKASDIITTFQPFFPSSTQFGQISALLLATHALSFYSLTLQRGIPLQPVNIRISPDALSLIDKVLKQNPRSYTKLDDLIDIGRYLFLAGLVRHFAIQTQSTEDSLRMVERRVIVKAIEAALVEEDFETAYSYVVTRLSPIETVSANVYDLYPVSTSAQNDITWTAAYAAGRSRSRNANGSSELRRLEQRMELLSKALLLAPNTALKEVLDTWRDCEQEMNNYLAQEVEDEEKWADQGERTVPGEFSVDEFAIVAQKPREPTRNAINEEAPMGLFDVARGAATAFSKSAFPLRSPRLADPNVKSLANTAGTQATSPADLDNGQHGDGAGRVRKRDMVSNMVTGGLASGIGWVLGAPPVREE